MSSNSSNSSDEFDSLQRRISEFVRLTSELQFHHLFDEKETLDALNFKTKCLWEKVKFSTDMDDASMTEVSKHYTKILNSFVEFDLQLPPCLFESLFHCTSPNLMNKLFAQNLVNFTHTRNLEHFKVLMNKDDDYIFVGLSDVDELTQTYELIMTLTVLIYRIKCLKFRESIIMSMSNLFTEFIFFEKYEDPVRKVAIRKLIEALILNGIFNVNNLNAFLMRTRTDVQLNHHNHHIHHHHHHHHVNAINNVILVIYS